MFKNNRSLLIIALIAVINSLGYGIIIPILYSYSLKYGLTDFENGLLFAIFSICQFISTPIIGRLSDKFGRRPLLISSIFGTAVSFFMAAFAPSAFFLFLARALDGITAGNIPVASAVISDTTSDKERAKGFGIIGAAFGFGFVFGPAISAVTLRYGENVPFIIAGVVSLITVFITYFFLPETNKHMGGHVNLRNVFDFKKLVTAVADKATGMTLLLSLIYNIAFGLFIFTFQPFAVKILELSANTISVIYTIYGIVGLVAQGLIIPRVVRKYGEKNGLLFSFILGTLSFIGMYVSRDVTSFIVISVAFGIGNSFFLPVVQSLLSKEVDAKSQGTILGLNSSYISLGTIIGPILGGFIATFGIPLPFILGAILSCICFVLVYTKIKSSYHHEESLA